METFFWIALVLLLMALPVIQMIPSPKQKQRAQLRQSALELGLVVQFCHMPKSPADTAEPSNGRGAEQAQRQAIAYRLRRSPEDKALFKQHTTYRIKTDAAQQSYPGFNEKLNPSKTLLTDIIILLRQLPTDVAVFESSPSHLSVYWHEQGQADDVATIQHCLHSVYALELTQQQTPPNTIARQD